jgi:hypothetical protein
MALTQDQRIEISKKIVSIPTENALALDSKSKMDDIKLKIQTQDDGNKSILDAKTALVNGYQSELKRLDGNDRSEVSESDMLNSATNKAGNFFFPNLNSTPTPSLSDGVWKQFIPFARNKAVGKSYAEVYTSTAKEGDIITLIQNYNTTMDGYTGIQRTTGQKCTAGTPPASDVIANDATLQTLANNIITQVTAWKTFLTDSLALILTTDPNTTRQSQNNVSIADINNSISVINTWLAKPKFDTSHGQTTCSGFNSYNPFLLQTTKFRTDVFNTLKNEIIARLAFIETRKTQIQTNLGSIVQDTSNGHITSSSGLYGERFSFIDLRINLVSGTLRKLESLKLGQKAQDESIVFNQMAETAYSAVMFASLLSSPSTGDDKLHLKDASAISVGDTVYIVADEQQEVELSVVSKTNNMLQLNQSISLKYRLDNNSRIYKIL